jgi:hypothetical protein
MHSALFFYFFPLIYVEFMRNHMSTPQFFLKENFEIAKDKGKQITWNL